MNRIVEYYAKALQVLERLTKQRSKNLEALGTDDVACVITQNICVNSRGIKDVNYTQLQVNLVANLNTTAIPKTNSNIFN